MSESDSYQSSQLTSEPDLVALDAKIMAVMDGTEELEREIGKMMALQQAISDYKKSHQHRTQRTKEKLTDMSKDLTITGKNIVKSCEERLKQISDVTEPYINSGISSVEDHTSSVVERCIQMLGAISGLGGAMKKTEGLSSKVLEHHRKLAIMEHKQADAISRYEKAVGVQKLVREHPAGDPLHELANLLGIFLALQQSPNTSEYYKKVFDGFGGRVTALFAEIDRPKTAKSLATRSGMSTLSSMSNGEINLESIKDNTEIPVDTCQ